MTVHQWTFDIPTDLWMSANQRTHWAVRARRTRTLRTEAALRAHHAGRHDPLDRVHVTATIGYPRTGRADPANAAPTVKALIDGIVDAGLIPDDDHTHLTGPDYRRGPTTGRPGIHTVTLTIVPIPEETHA